MTGYEAEELRRNCLRMLEYAWRCAGYYEGWSLDRENLAKAWASFLHARNLWADFQQSIGAVPPCFTGEGSIKEFDAFAAAAIVAGALRSLAGAPSW